MIVDSNDQIAVIGTLVGECPFTCGPWVAHPRLGFIGTANEVRHADAVPIHDTPPTASPDRKCATGTLRQPGPRSVSANNRAAIPAVIAMVGLATAMTVTTLLAVLGDHPHRFGAVAAVLVGGFVFGGLLALPALLTKPPHRRLGSCRPPPTVRTPAAGDEMNSRSSGRSAGRRADLGEGVPRPVEAAARERQALGRAADSGGEAAAGRPLVTSQLSLPGTDPNARERRRSSADLARLLIARTCGDLEAAARIVQCGRAVRSRSGVVLKRSSDGYVYASGLVTCGSPWSCLSCSYKIRAKRARHIAIAIAAHLALGGGVLFGTFTMSHDRSEPLT